MSENVKPRLNCMLHFSRNVVSGMSYMSKNIGCVSWADPGWAVRIRDYCTVFSHAHPASPRGCWVARPAPAGSTGRLAAGRHGIFYLRPQTSEATDRPPNNSKETGEAARAARAALLHTQQAERPMESLSDDEFLRRLGITRDAFAALKFGRSLENTPFFIFLWERSTCTSVSIDLPGMHLPYHVSHLTGGWRPQVVEARD